MAHPRRAGDDFGKVFGRGIRALREQRGLKQVTLAQEVGYGDHSQITKIESGDTVPSLEKAMRLAAYLEVSLEMVMQIGRGEPDTDTVPVCPELVAMKQRGRDLLFRMERDMQELAQLHGTDTVRNDISPPGKYRFASFPRPAAFAFA